MDADRRTVFPFYIFITLLLGYLGIESVSAVWAGRFNGLIFGVAVLFLLHIGMYWLNAFLAERNKRWYLFYYPIQTVLIVSIFLALRNYFVGGLSVFFSTIISMIGEVLGVWGNSRRSFWLGLFYVGLLFAVFYFFSDASVFFDALSSLLVTGGTIILFMVMFNDQIRQRQKALELAESLESANAKLAAYNAKIESLTLQNERQRMARELHDTLAQGVAGLVLQLEAVKAHLSADRKERASAIVEQALLRARATLAESRAAIDDLRSAPVNLPELIQEKVKRFIQTTGIPCDLELIINENEFSNETINHAVSILSEALANITKHAQAKRVELKFVIQNKKLELQIQDDGVGFDTRQENSGHYGLLGMRERARLTNGNLEIESNSNGTRIRFSLAGAT